MKSLNCLTGLLLLPLLATAGPTAREVIERRCLECHGSAAKSTLDLRTREGMLRAEAIVPGHPDKSPLIRVLSREELRMPLGRKPLPAEEIAALEQWIREGASWDAALSDQPTSDWWAFQPPKKAAPPGDAANPVDAFVNAKLAEKGLAPIAAADRRTLIRRAHFDLIGLPPTFENVERFVHDPDPRAFAKVVDELLASSRYGERWGRHWLDVVRYADTGGFETDLYFPNAWRYRDYVIKSFNDDKPYDRFVKEQIAADEIWPDDLETRGSYHLSPEKEKHLEARIGTGLYTIGTLYAEAALDGRQLRYEWLVDSADVTSEVFMGLTLGCARCHDHKFDPLTQRDYHRMMAVFADSEPIERSVVNQNSQLSYMGGFPRLIKVEEYKAAVKRIDAAAKKRALDAFKAKFPRDLVEAYEVPEGKRTPEQQKLAVKFEFELTEVGFKKNPKGKEPELTYTANERDDRERLIYELGQAALSSRIVRRQATVLGHSEIMRPVYMTSRGDYRSVGKRVSAGFPAVLTGGTEVRATQEPEQGLFVPQRRKALAEWLTDPEHPLTARVMVNRIWQGHFGRGLVGTPNDFGRQGDAPTHSELLDWLAADFVENGWSVKSMHRRIMLSNAYGRSSAPDEANARTDATNLYLWRMNRRRLEAEALRDNVLAASGALNLKMGGRSVVPVLTSEEMRGMWSKDQWPVSLDPAEHNRRSVYLYTKRSFPLPLFTTFDAPDTSVSCSRRTVTTVAPQALALMNSEFMQDQARVLADRVRAESLNDHIAGVWRLALGREPSAYERARATALLEGLSSDALTQVCLLAMNLNEFVYVD